MSQRSRLSASLVANMALLGTMVMSSVASAGDIRVAESGGEDLRAVGPTEVHLTSMLPGQVVSIERIQSTRMGTGMSYGYTFSSYAQTTEPLCHTPCTLNLDPGSYSLRAGKTLYSPTFQIDAGGGRRTWEVREVRPGRVVGGILGASLGFGLLLSGAVASSVDSGSGSDAVMLGIPVSAASIPLLVSGLGKARETSRQ